MAHCTLAGGDVREAFSEFTSSCFQAFLGWTSVFASLKFSFPSNIYLMQHTHFTLFIFTTTTSQRTRFLFLLGCPDGLLYTGYLRYTRLLLSFSCFALVPCCRTVMAKAGRPLLTGAPGKTIPLRFYILCALGWFAFLLRYILCALGWFFFVAEMGLWNIEPRKVGYSSTAIQNNYHNDWLVIPFHNLHLMIRN